jgi:hypothetical protein
MNFTGEQLAEARDAILMATAKYRNLVCYGFCTFPHQDNTFAAEQVATAIAFLRTCSKSRLPRMGSYALKHRAETWGSAHGLASYVANGELIVAAVFLGFTVQPHKGSPNATINAWAGWVMR